MTIATVADASTPARRSASPAAAKRRGARQTVATDCGPVVADPEESARAAGLRYVSDAEPGIRRRRAGRAFGYVGADGVPIRDPDQLRRVKALAIPPAWTDVWICPRANGHIQATGRDARGRKQYRYHPRWRAVRDETKYGRMLAFAGALPRIRERVAADLHGQGLSREKVLAAVVRLMEETLIRVGNEEYARANRSFGLTTLRDKHVTVDESALRFSFKGKSGKQHTVGLRDRRLARVVRRCRDLPGQTLFQYVDDEGEVRAIDSADVNAYLREIAGDDFTAKDFRTWHGSVLAAERLAALDPPESTAAATHAEVEVIGEVAVRLGNTPAICRRCYVHPLVIEAFEDGRLAACAADVDDCLGKDAPEIEPEERLFLALLRHGQDP